jgi:ribosome-associated protein
MARKPKKGYFVKGQFVAEGSEEDLALKREAKGNEGTSKTDLKRESVELQKLGEDLMGLRSALMLRLTSQGHVNEKLSDALVHARQITNFEGRRRQMQFIGKLMRKLPEEALQAVRDALYEQHSGSASETLSLHLSEQWRLRLIDNDAALDEWVTQHPDTDIQQLRALVRQARKDGLPEKTAVSQGQFPRQGRAFRDIFKLVRAHLHATTPTVKP